MEESEQNPAPPPPTDSDITEPALKKTKMSSDTTSSDDTTATITPRRYKRRKVAIFMAYCGVGYQGMQKNPGAKTIEGDLEDALFLAGAVPADERGQHKRYDWARSARTDKGVSAVGQVISGRFFVDPPGFVNRLNSILSPQIRVFGFNRATPSFNAKKFCDRRRYVYLLPVFALDPSCHRDRESVLESLGSGEELVRCFECSERGRKVSGVMGNNRDFRNQGLLPQDLELGVASSKSCDVSMLEVKEEGTNESVVGEEVKTEVGSQVLGQSGVSCNSHDASMLQVKEEEGVVDAGAAKCLNDEDGGVAVEVSAELGISTNSCDTSMLQLKEEKSNVIVVKVKTEVDDQVLGQSGIEEQKVDVCVENGNKVGEELKKDDVGNVQGRVLDQSGVRLNNESDGVGEGRKSEFKYGEEVKERLNRILKYYEGTHNFHNFTTRTKAEDPSAKRYIVSFQANTTLTLEGIEFIKCEVVGQSFMLHQIRKMMGMAVAVMRNFASESIYDTAFDQVVRINVPTAPEVGLYLDECFFTSYNKKWNGTHEELSMKDYAEEAEEFKVKYIYSHIANTEHKEGAVAIWLHSLNKRNYPDLCPSQEGAPDADLLT
ncbi:hypothetical protein KSS87_000956 [Heliosperma pusillum]|nr:hypothetical protein KSS87_000956 [Heliosperma pusillum]